MKRLYLIKPTKYPQLSHLYEHIVCSAITSYFFENKVYPRIDYLMFANTFDSGLTLVELALYTAKAENAANKIASLPVEFTDDNVVTASTQLLAEYEKPLVCKDFEALKEALGKIHAIKWQDLENIETVDTKNIRKSYPIFYIAEGNTLPAKKLALSIKIAPNFIDTHRDLLPLFRELASLTIDNLEELLADKFGYYSFSYKFYDNRHKTQLTNTFKVANQNDPSVEPCLATAAQIIGQLVQEGVFAKYTNGLRNTSYFNNPANSPNVERIYEDTHVLIGSNGWRKLSTQDNLDELLKHMSIEVKFGRQTLEAHPFTGGKINARITR